MVQRAQRLDELTYRLAAHYRTLLHDYHRRMEIAAARIRHFDFRRSLAVTRSRLDSGTEALVRTFRARLATQRAQLEHRSAQLEALSPAKILERGYALVFDSSGALVKDGTLLTSGSEVTARVARGSFTAEVKQTKSE